MYKKPIQEIVGLNKRNGEKEREENNFLAYGMLKRRDLLVILGKETCHFLLLFHVVKLCSPFWFYSCAREHVILLCLDLS